MTWIRFVLKLYFFMVAHKAACQTLSKAFLKSRWLSRRGRRSGKIAEVLLVLEIFLTKDSQVKICSVVLLPALRAYLFFGYDRLRFWLQSVQYVFSMTLLG